MIAAAANLSDSACRAFVGLYGLAGDGGALPGIEALAAELGLSQLAAARTLAALADAGLVGEDEEGRMRLGRGAITFPASSEADKIVEQSTDNVVALPGRDAAVHTARTPAERARAYRRRRKEFRKEAAQQLKLPLLGVVGNTSGVLRPVTASVTRVTAPVTRVKKAGVTIVANGRDDCGEAAGKIEEIQQDLAMFVTEPAIIVTEPAVTPVTGRSYIYSSLKDDLLEEDIHTTGVTRHAPRRDAPPHPADKVIDHCLPRWPPRKGDNPRGKARSALRRAWRQSDNPDTVIAAFERWRKTDYVLEHQGTKYIPQAATWFGERRWEDYPETAPPARQDAAAAIRAPPAIDPAAAGDRRWACLAERLAADIGPDMWTAWFARLVPTGCADGTLRIAAPTRFVATWIETNYGDRLHAAASDVYGAGRVVVQAMPAAVHAAKRARGPP